MSSILRIAWKRWEIIGRAFGDFQGRAFAVLFYFTIFVPFALIFRLNNDPLQLRSGTLTWLEREPVGTELDDARRQY